MANSTICRLCLECNEDLLDIFRDEEDVLRINDVLTHYSIIELKDDDEISNKICCNCWSSVYDFHEFCLRVQKIQESISSIIYVDSKNNVNEVVLASVCDADIAAADAVNDAHQKDKITLIVKNEEKMLLSDIAATAAVNDANLKDEITLIVKNEEKVLLTVEEGTCDDEDILESEVVAEVLTETDRTDKSISPKGCISEDEPETQHKLIEKLKPLTKRNRRKASEEEESNEKLINAFFNLTCELCQKHYTCCGKLFHHYEVSHKIRGFIMCCAKKYFKITKIAEHVLWHRKPELFRCTKCNLEKVFSDKKHLEAHMITHIDSNSSVFQCEYCDKTFIKKYRYDQHKLTHLPPEEKKYICHDCGKPYATEALLRVHVRVVHMKSYAHMCEICAKIFKSRVFFEKHQLEHMGQSLPRVQCKICNAWMKNEHTMRAHMRLHDDEGTVHECDLCGKTGPSRNAILKHKRYVHFSERKFKCTLCEKAFKRAVSLKEHMTVHTGEVLYKCTFCSKTFNSGANMFAHKKKMHFSQWKTEKEHNSK